MHYMGLFAFSIPNSPVMIVRIRVLSFHYHYQIGSMNHLPLFRVRLWQNARHLLSLYILTIFFLWCHCVLSTYVHTVTRFIVQYKPPGKSNIQVRNNIWHHQRKCMHCRPAISRHAVDVTNCIAQGNASFQTDNMWCVREMEFCSCRQGRGNGTQSATSNASVQRSRLWKQGWLYWSYSHTKMTTCGQIQCTDAVLPAYGFPL